MSYEWLCYVTSSLSEPLVVLYFHILRENNGLAYKLANQGSRSTQGVIVYNGKKRLYKYVP